MIRFPFILLLVLSSSNSLARECSFQSIVPSEDIRLEVCREGRSVTLEIHGTDRNERAVEFLREMRIGDIEPSTTSGNRVLFQVPENQLNQDIRIGEMIFANIREMENRTSVITPRGPARPEIMPISPALTASEAREILNTDHSLETALRNSGIREGQGRGLLGNTTDLHTHFAGAMRGESLVANAEAVGYSVPPSFFSNNNLQIPEDFLNSIKNEDGNIPIRQLGQYRQTLINSLSIPSDRLVDFDEMERLYALRRPFTKIDGDEISANQQMEMLRRNLRSIAEDYRRAGVTYAELSVSDIFNNDDPRFYNVAAEAVENIERELGVQLRFLAAIWRGSGTDDADAAAGELRYIRGAVDDIISVVPERPLIVGVDVMGEEVNSSQFFSNEIRRLSDALRPEGLPSREGFQIRIHAGENALHANNIKDAINAGATRIGHGIYGVDQETLDLAILLP